MYVCSAYVWVCERVCVGLTSALNGRQDDECTVLNRGRQCIVHLLRIDVFMGNPQSPYQIEDLPASLL